MRIVPNAEVRKWGYILGDITDQLDLPDYIKSFIAWANIKGSPEDNSALVEYVTSEVAAAVPNIGANRIGVGDPATGNLVGSTLALLDPDAGFQFYTDLTIRNTFNPINGTYSSLYLQRSDNPSNQLVLQSGEDGSFITAVNQGLILQATALQFKAVQDVIYFYTNTTTQKGYFDSNGFTVIDRFNVGGDTPIYPGKMNLASSTAGVNRFTIQNLNGNGYSDVLFTGQNGNHFADFFRMNTNVPGGPTGTHIPYGDLCGFVNSTTGSDGTGPFATISSIVYGIIGTSPDNRGYRADATGIRFDTNDSLHIANTYNFQVGQYILADSDNTLYSHFRVTSPTNANRTLTMQSDRDANFIIGTGGGLFVDATISDLSLRTYTNQAINFYTNSTLVAHFDGDGSFHTSGEIIQSFGSSQPFRISNRDVSLPFPVPMIMPVNNDQVIAFDIMPRGNPVESAGNGFAWMDICDTDCANTSPDFTTTRIGNTSAYVEFGSRRWGAAALKPLAITLDGTPFLLADPSGVTITSALLTLVGPGMVMGGAFINSDAGASIANNANINGERGITAYNANTGSGAWATFNVNSDTGEGALRTYSSGFTFDSGNYTNKTHLLGTHGLVVSTNGSIDFLVNSFAFAAKTMSIGPTTISLPNIPTGNAGLVSGQVYKDTPANIAANGDLVLGIKV